MSGGHLAAALATRARVAIAEGDPALAECHARVGARVRGEGAGAAGRPDILDASLGWPPMPAVCGRRREGSVRRRRSAPHGPRALQDLRRGYERSVATVRAALSAMIRRRMGRRGRAVHRRSDRVCAARPHWPEAPRPRLDVADTDRARRGATRRGKLPTDDVAARLFVSPRTVQIHLTHIYAKPGVTSRVQLAQEAAGQG